MVNNRDRESHIIYTWPQSAKPYRESHLCDWLSTHFVRIRYAICTHSFHACLSNNVTIFEILCAGFVVCFVLFCLSVVWLALRGISSFPHFELALDRWEKDGFSGISSQQLKSISRTILKITENKWQKWNTDINFEAKTKSIIHFKMMTNKISSIFQL